MTGMFAESARPTTRVLAHLGAAAMACAFSAAQLIAEVDPRPQLAFLSAMRIADKSDGFLEPSGLAVAGDGGTFWSVSDDSEALFRLSRSGEIVERIPLGKKMNDLEGVTEDPLTGRILMVREASAEIIEIPPTRSDKAIRHRLADMNGYRALGGIFDGADDNNGLEGITVVPDIGTVLVLKENQPRALIELTPDLSTIRGLLPLTAAMGFVDDDVDDKTLDVSDVVYDHSRKALWITSDTGRRVFLLDPVAQHASGYPLLWLDNGHKRLLRNAEGVAVSEDGSRLSIVSDDGKESRFVEYSIQ